jgi:NTP pyrophosphatase (non-canonical NTP hydrolase)
MSELNKEVAMRVIKSLSPREPQDFEVQPRENGDFEVIQADTGAVVQYKPSTWVEPVEAAGNLLRDVCHAASAGAGWWQDIYTGEPIIQRQHVVGEKLMLVVSEVAEAMEGHRKNLQDDKLPHRKMIEVELADAVIRICDLAGAMSMDLGGAIAEKLAYNAQREDHKLEARKAAGGKSY